MLDYLMDASRNTALNAAGEWRPPVDVFQMDDELTVLIELAGMAEDDIEVVLFDDVLVVKGERKPTIDGERELTYYEAGGGLLALEGRSRPRRSFIPEWLPEDRAAEPNQQFAKDSGTG
jgi:hypothetical protein